MGSSCSDKSFTSPQYKVLAIISNGYSLLQGRFPCVTHPFATSRTSYCYDSCPFDLHVLSTPPAFTLSQDQTLKFCPDYNSNYWQKQYILNYINSYVPLSLNFILSISKNLQNNASCETRQQNRNRTGSKNTPYTLGCQFLFYKKNFFFKTTVQYLSHLKSWDLSGSFSPHDSKIIG